MFNPTISPHDPNTVLVSCDMTGSYITHDGGQSWRMFNLRGVVGFFVFDPTNPKIIYAQATGLWRSTDGGESWNLVYPKPSTIKDVVMKSDHADEVLVAEPNPLGTVTALAVDPSDSHVLYVASGDKSTSALFISRDFGESWQEQASLPETPRRVWVDPQSPTQARTLFIASPHFVAVKSASGVRRLPTPESVTFTDVALGFVPGAQPIVYATSEAGAFVSRDGGGSWHKSLLPGTGYKVRAIATSLQHATVAYISYSNLAQENRAWLGVAKTENAGESWQLAWKESGTAAGNVHDAWITQRFGVGWGENPLELVVAEQDPNLCYGTDLGRTMKTTDGGATWAATYSRKTKGGWTSTGLDVTNGYGIHFDPFHPQREFITYTDIGLFRSEDGGGSWQSSTSGVPESWLNTTYWIVFDPKVPDRVWSVNSYTHDLPRPKMWRKNSVLNYKGGVCRSEDGGKTWKKSNTGMEETAATHILLDPNSPPDARVLYVAAFGRGVYKSTDGGKTWSLKNQGIRQEQPFAWRLAQASDGTLYVVLARRSEDGSFGNAGDGAIYRSRDQGQHWEPVPLPQDVNGPNGLAIDPGSPQRLYIAAWARASGTHGDGGGIYLSEDGARSWRRVFDRDRHVYDITIDPKDDNILYAAGFESSAWRSSNRGKSWTRIPGFNFKWGYRVIPDPQDGGKVYVTTFGGSVWQGSVKSQDAPLDIATPVLRPEGSQ